MSQNVQESKEKSEFEEIAEIENIFKASKHSIDKSYSHLQKTSTQYFQSVTDLQETMIEYRKNLVNTAIKLQLDFCRKLGLSPKISEMTIQYTINLAEQTIQAQTNQCQMFLASIDAFRKGIEALDSNTKTSSEMNKTFFPSFLQLWFKSPNK